MSQLRLREDLCGYQGKPGDTSVGKKKTFIELIIINRTQTAAKTKYKVKTFSKILSRSFCKITFSPLCALTN